MKTAISLVALLFAQEGPSVAELTRQYAGEAGPPATRYRAEARLVHLGRPALEILEREKLLPDRIPAFRSRIELHEKLKDSYGPPRTYTFDGAEEALGNYLSRLEAGSGVTLYKNQVDMSARLSVPIKDAPFWEALDAVCRQAGLLYYPNMSDQLYLTNGTLPEKPRNYYGPILLTLDRVVQERRIRFDGAEIGLTARLACVWERHLVPRGVTKRYRLTAAADDKGASLLPGAESPPEPASRPLSMTSTVTEMVDLKNLRPLSAGAKRIAILEGTLELEFPERIDQTVFRSPLDPPSAPQALDGLSVELRNCYPSSSTGIIADFGLVFRDEAEASAYRVNSRDLSFSPSLGSRSQGYVYNVKLEKNVVTFSVRYYGTGPASEIKQLALRVPRGSLVMHVPFSFRDVELK